jgi:hypothetical protein
MKGNISQTKGIPCGAGALFPGSEKAKYTLLVFFRLSLQVHYLYCCHIADKHLQLNDIILYMMIMRPLFFFQWLFQPTQGPGLLFSSVIIFFFTGGRTPWANDQPVARPLPTHRTIQTQNKRIHTPNIYALSGIRTHDPSVRASEDSSCLRTRGYCHRLM